mmetsp:Transcript_27550/g.51660  ORF Transcript_27550/g.51660 Transcript_27550/m.51660 type:complete len:218 (-) Transcript_27550:152-805(-)
MAKEYAQLPVPATASEPPASSGCRTAILWFIIFATLGLIALMGTLLFQALTATPNVSADATLMGGLGDAQHALNCFRGDPARWPQGWSDMCCASYGVGCPHHSAGAGVQQPYNCHDTTNIEFIKQSWSQEHMSFCCNSYGIACAAFNTRSHTSEIIKETTETGAAPMGGQDYYGSSSGSLQDGSWETVSPVEGQTGWTTMVDGHPQDFLAQPAPLKK